MTRKGAYGRFEGPGIVMHEWALPEEADPDDIRAVKQANPHKGITLKSLKAKRARPTMTEAHWRTVHLQPADTDDDAGGDGEGMA